MKIREARREDFSTILELNQESVHFLSPLDDEGLAHLHAQSAYHRVVENEDGVWGFLLALGPGGDYHSPNYLWFQARHSDFLYIDRVVIAASGRGRGLGARLYEDLFDFAQSHGFKRITCEFDVEPPNRASARFHGRFGFLEVGRQTIASSGKRVSMQSTSIL